MNVSDKIKVVRQGFEESFSEKNFYEKQTTDDSHLELLINMLKVKAGSTVLDLGTGTGYIAFPLARRYSDSKIIGLDIVEETLKRNSKKVIEEKLDNLSFVSYDGYMFPFDNDSIDSIITRYALHHFPDIEQAFSDMYRILKPNGKLIISDPTPNRNDYCRFVDKFMKMKPDGHVRFYYLDEYKEMLEHVGFSFISNKTTSIRFPRKGASQYEDIISETNQDILSGYCIEVDGDEIWITESVLNMLFVK
ncbi:Methyltransferase domain [Clostridium bornimense]|uniref:Methyltransferase domain n=1 Tax=Clostridium bornimense TaxID=1216932 RepID=W6S103_9CLOT|nr:class I SAM-dependent methyltransferase [Clostridium bornimense]CDM70393.1 Methyltransferase domain [Clostridium bornimense]